MVISAAENQLLVSAATVVDGRQVIAYRAQVRELHVSLADALTSARQRFQPAFHRFNRYTWGVNECNSCFVDGAIVT